MRYTVKAQFGTEDKPLSEWTGSLDADQSRLLAYELDVRDLFADLDAQPNWPPGPHPFAIYLSNEKGRSAFSWRAPVERDEA